MRMEYKAQANTRQDKKKEEKEKLRGIQSASNINDEVDLELSKSILHSKLFELDLTYG